MSNRVRLGDAALTRVVETRIELRTSLFGDAAGASPAFPSLKT